MEERIINNLKQKKQAERTRARPARGLLMMYRLVRARISRSVQHTLFSCVGSATHSTFMPWGGNITALLAYDEATSPNFLYGVAICMKAPLLYVLVHYFSGLFTAPRYHTTREARTNLK